MSAEGPSLKALGKRRLHSPPALASAPISGTTDAGKTEKRVTRSSLPGPGSRDGNGSNGNEDAGLPPLYLPTGTPVLLTLQAPPNLSHHPPIALEEATATASTSSSSPTSGAIPPPPLPPTAPPPTTTPSAATEEKDVTPPFRLLGPGDTFTKSRHISAAQADLSDAHFQRLHRFPEVLEKRSARLERERLIHERAQLMMEIEQMRSRAWVYGTIPGAGGRAQEERKRKLKELEERLKRYDALLPQQPRKSGFLNNGGGAAGSSRDGSPALTSAQNQLGAQSRRHATPVSASGDGGTTIRIKFAAGGAGGGNLHKARKYDAIDGEDADEEEEYQQETGLKAKKPDLRKRDRRAEKERAAFRKQLREQGINPNDPSAPPMPVTVKLKTPHPPPPKKARSTFFLSEALRDSVSLALLGEPTTVAAGGGAASAANRRSSGRVMYAFGHRLPDVALSRHRQFELYGGVDGPSPSSLLPPTIDITLDAPHVKEEALEDEATDYARDSGIPLETLVRQRNALISGKADSEPAYEIVNGVAIPASSLAAVYRSPIKVIQPQTLAVQQPPTSSGQNHGHGTRHAGSKVVKMSPRGRMEIAERIDD